MMLVEKIHFAAAAVKVGETIESDGIILHCTDIYDGMAVFMWRTSPDVTEQDIKQEGREKRRQRLAGRAARRTVARTRPKK